MRLRSSFCALMAGTFLLGAIGSSVQAQGTAGSVSGVVTSAASSVPLPDARVAIAGTVVFTITGPRGEYRLGNVPAGPVTLTFTRIGFKQERVRVTIVAGNNSVHNQSLTESVANLTEVVVTGTAGNQERRAQAATVASVNAADLVASAPISSVQELLTSRSPGVSVNKASGSAGTSSQIHIRGVSSISLSNTPLIFVDGIRVSEGLPTAGGGTLGLGLNQTADRLNDINADDIESIEVVKGPAAATLYGADASVGVIQIITKRGKIGGQKFVQNVKYEYANIDAAWTPPSNYGNCTAASILATSTNPLCRGGTLGQLVSDNPLVRTGAFRTGLDRNVGWSGRGGGQAFSYFLSLGYDNTVGTLPNNEFKRYSARTNLTFQPAPEWTVDFSGNFVRSNTTLPDNDNNIYGFLGGGLLGSPLTRNDGGPGASVIPPSSDGWFGFARQVAAITAIQNVVQTHRNLYSMAVNYAPRNWFTNRVTFGADMLRDEITRFFPKNSVGNYAAALNIGSNVQSRTGFERFTFDYLGNVRSTWLSEQQLETNVSFGLQTIATRTEQLGAQGTGFVTNANNVIRAAASSSGDQTYTEQTQVGFLGQLQLGWRNKFFVQAAARSDRFSSFGRPDDAFLLPKFGISYVLSEEKWLTIPFVSQMRLRAAYGETGRSPGAGAALTTLASAPYAITGGGGQAAGAVPFNPGNSNLKAERGVELEYGLDWSMFRDRVSFEVTYFDKTSKDLLLRVPLAPSLGFSQNPFKNIGEVKNSGLEVGVNAKMVTMRNFTWDMRFSMNTLDNKVTSLGGPVATGGVAPFFIGNTGRIDVGLQLGSMVSKRILSIDTLTKIVMVDSAYTPRANILPTFEASLSNSVTIGKYARVTALIDTKRDFSVYNLTDFFRETQLVRSNKRLDPTVLSTYERLRRFGNQTPGQPAFVQTGGGAETVNNVNEAYIMPGDFVRFRELALTITLPQSFASSMRLAGGSVTLAMQNIALWTNFQGADPEVLSNAGNEFDRSEFLTVPTPKRAVIKVNFSF